MPIQFTVSDDVVDDLVTVYKGAVPPDMKNDLDSAYAQAAVISVAEGVTLWLGRGMNMSTAVGVFLDQWGHDLGLERQNGETDVQYLVRLRQPPKAGTAPAILAALTAIVGDGAILVELPRASMYADSVNHSFLDRGLRCGAGRGIVIALIPASANALASCTDAVRSEASAGKITLVQEYNLP